MRQYRWYETVGPRKTLAQGDFITECPFVTPPNDIDSKKEGEDIGGVPIKKYNVVVMSQSCDLEQNKIKTVLVCPYMTLKEAGESRSDFKNQVGKNKLRRGEVIGYHLLNKCSLKDFENDFLVVDFRNVLSIPVEVIITVARRRGRRLRLLPPYREHLAQAFARFFMRVGLPIDIPEFT